MQLLSAKGLSHSDGGSFNRHFFISDTHTAGMSDFQSTIPWTLHNVTVCRSTHRSTPHQTDIASHSHLRPNQQRYLQKMSGGDGIIVIVITALADLALAAQYARRRQQEERGGH